ncbi:MAG: radical SAM protein [Deltaproteobacteria bacterium]|nr:radical SAM protein [Deltaproteobacteria bacterium]
MKVIKVTTGSICIMEGAKGLPLEFLSIGDYGKEKNLKADFMGLTEEINGVAHGELLPLEEKWVITISSQYGCSMGCTFCDVPKVGKGINATIDDLMNQVKKGISLHPEVKSTKRLNLHYARMGEPTYNFDVIESAYKLKDMFDEMRFGFHPVVSTMMPRNNGKLIDFLDKWLYLKHCFNGEAGLQLSINTTDKKVRQETMPNALSLDEISDIMNSLTFECGLRGRKITLNFAITDAPIDAVKLRKWFDPKYFICKLTPMHNTIAVINGNMITNDGYDFYYPYQKIEEDLKKVGFDVLVFIPSKEEDESRITCGNAILSDIMV